MRLKIKQRKLFWGNIQDSGSAENLPCVCKTDVGEEGKAALTMSVSETGPKLVT